MNKLTPELLHQLQSAAQEEIMCREASDTSDAWQDLASPENILLLVEIALPVLEQNEAPTDTYRQIENDGWIEWGGDCGPYHKPVDGSVEVKFKGGGKNRGSASIWSWKHNDCDSDIIAYRVIENDGREG